MKKNEEKLTCVHIIHHHNETSYHKIIKLIKSYKAITSNLNSNTLQSTFQSKAKLHIGVD